MPEACGHTLVNILPSGPKKHLTKSEEQKVQPFSMWPCRERILVISSRSSGEILDFLSLPRAIRRHEVLGAC